MRTVVTHIMFAAASIAITAGAVVISSPSVASVPQLAAPHALVRFDDLNLTSDAGRTTLDRRIRAAAEKVCEDGDDMSAHIAAARCRTVAIDDAHRQADAVASAEMATR